MCAPLDINLICAQNNTAPNLLCALPLYNIHDFHSKVVDPASLPEFELSKLEHLSTSSTYLDYKTLTDSQNALFNQGYSPVISIHSYSAVKFYSTILNANEFVMSTLLYGYSPGFCLK